MLLCDHAQDIVLDVLQTVGILDAGVGPAGEGEAVRRLQEGVALPVRQAAVRFCTGWSTRDEDVDALIQDIAAL